MVWNEDQINFLIAQFRKGKSHREIAADMSIIFREKVTRNAIIGKLHRLRLHVSDVRSKVAPKKEKPAILRPKLTNRFVKRSPPIWEKKMNDNTVWIIEPPSEFNCEIMQLSSRRCKWPYGDNPPFVYCGAPASRRNYCHFHYRKSLRWVEIEQQRKPTCANN